MQNDNIERKKYGRNTHSLQIAKATQITSKEIYIYIHKKETKNKI